MTDNQKKRLEYVKQRVSRRASMYERCFTGKASLAFRIKTFCLDCMGINCRLAKTCTVDTCPLWGGRPHKWIGGRPKANCKNPKPASEAQLAVRNTFKLLRNRSQESSKRAKGTPENPPQDEF